MIYFHIKSKLNDIRLSMSLIRNFSEKKNQETFQINFESSALIAAFQSKHENLSNKNGDEQQKQTNKHIDQKPQIERRTYYCGYETKRK